MFYSISTGVHAHVSANPHKARDVGQLILNKMLNKFFGEFHFKKKDQVLTLDHKSSIRIDNEVIQIDPLLLFQRLHILWRMSLSMNYVVIHQLSLNLLFCFYRHKNHYWQILFGLY